MSRKWVKHLVQAHSDPFVANMLSTYGPVAYGIYWILVEKSAEAAYHTGDPTVRLTKAQWMKIFHVYRWDQCSKVLSSMKDHNKIVYSSQNGIIELGVPKVLQYKDEYRKKQDRKVSKSTDTCPDTTPDKSPDLRKQGILFETAPAPTSAPPESPKKKPRKLVDIDAEVDRLRHAYMMRRGDYDHHWQAKGLDPETELRSIMNWVRANACRFSKYVDLDAFLCGCIKRARPDYRIIKQQEERRRLWDVSMVGARPEDLPE